MAAAATQGTYLTSPVTTLAHIPQVGALATPNGITTGALTPTTATLANGTLKSTSLKAEFILNYFYYWIYMNFINENLCHRKQIL